MSEPLMNTDAVAAYLGAWTASTPRQRRESALKFLRARGVPRYKVGRRWVVEKKDVDLARKGHRFKKGAAR